MTTGRTPSERLSDAATHLTQKDYSLDINQTNEQLFYINPNDTLANQQAAGEDVDRYYLEEYARETAHKHNLHFFTHNNYWCISTLPQEDTTPHHYR